MGSPQPAHIADLTPAELALAAARYIVARDGVVVEDQGSHTLTVTTSKDGLRATLTFWRAP